MKNENIYLRALEPTDIDLIYQWENDRSIWYLSNTVNPFSKYTIEQFYKNAHEDIYSTKQMRLMICLNSTLEAIGCIDLFDFDPYNQKVGTGILITEKNKRKGYASEALALLIDYVFKTLGLNQIYCNILEDNEPSLKLFQKFKFEITGNKLQWVKVNGQWKNEYILQLFNQW